MHAPSTLEFLFNAAIYLVIAALVDKWNLQNVTFCKVDDAIVTGTQTTERRITL